MSYPSFYTGDPSPLRVLAFLQELRRNGEILIDPAGEEEDLVDGTAGPGLGVGKLDHRPAGALRLEGEPLELPVGGLVVQAVVGAGDETLVADRVLPGVADRLVRRSGNRDLGPLHRDLKAGSVGQDQLLRFGDGIVIGAGDSRSAAANG